MGVTCCVVSDSGACLRRSWFCVPFLFFVAIVPAVAEINSWTKPGSGNWEEQAYWSLGVLPDATQSVMFTNAGWKALAMGANTAQNFPQSMRVQSLRVGAPVDSLNTLLINWTGFERPLQTTSLTIEPNGSVAIHGSVLEVIGTNWEAGNLNLQGTFIQSDLSLVNARSLSVSRGGRPGIASYFLTNGSLSVGGIALGGGYPGRFVQYGGSNNVGGIGIHTEGEYDLYGGHVTATNGIMVGSGDFADYSSFHQHGGTLNANTTINGRYFLNGGTITGHMSLAVSGQRVDASLVQNGGTNFAASLDLGHPNRFGGRASYTLSDGTVRVGSSVIFRGGEFSQHNGRHTIVSNLVMKGTELGVSFGFATADYFLGGGTLSAASLTAEAAFFRQEGGTNLIAGDIVLTAGPPQPNRPPPSTQYRLAAGFLSARNVMVDAFFGGFHQTGGSSQITEKLTVQGSNSTSLGYCCYYGYTLEGGTLAVKDLYVGTGAFFQHTSGNINHSGVLTLNGGNWHAAAGDHTLGPLQLGVEQSNRIVFTNGSSILRLTNSSAQPWASSAILYITNWHGSASGGGATRLYFGSNANGLTPQQLAQIRFNISGNVYPARILATGEVVPQMQTMLASSHSGNALTLTWGPGWILQSSTNVAGPYLDVQGAASPYTPAMGGPSRFFRLRQ